MKELSPDSKTPRLEQYQLAWQALNAPGLNDHKLHAKCWLTYRTFDGEITFDDWKRLIEPVAPIITESNHKTRWEVSIATATFYLAAIQGDNERLTASLDHINSQDLSTWPGCLLNWCRVNAVIAHDAMLSGRNTECFEIINRVISKWQNIMASFDPLHHPARFIESRYDTECLHFLMLTAEKIGILKSPMPDGDWTHPNNTGEPWMKCVRHLSLSRGKEKSKGNPLDHSASPTIKTRLVNDCSDYHVGSALVKAEILRHMEMAGMTLEEPARMVLINGEGTLHHNSTGSQRIREELQCVPDESVIAVINSIWQKMRRPIPKVKLAAARESFSADAMMRDGMGAEVWTAPDITLCCQHRPIHTGGQGLLVMDSTNPAADKWLKSITLKHGGRYLRMCEWKGTPHQFIDMLATFDRVISGRFHGITLCMLAGTPFLAAPSNSWKTPGLLHDLGLSACYQDSEQSMIAAIDSGSFMTLDRSNLARIDRQWRDIFARLRALCTTSNLP